MNDLIVDEQVHGGDDVPGEVVVPDPQARVLHEGVFDQDGQRPQDEGSKQVHVDVVPHAVKLPGTWKRTGGNTAFESHSLDELTLNPEL